MANRICTNCGTLARPKRVARGSLVIQLFLWLVLPLPLLATRSGGDYAMDMFLWFCVLLPGALYTLWRVSSRRDVCASCGNAGVIDPGSPRGQQLIAQLNRSGGNS